MKTASSVPRPMYDSSPVIINALVHESMSRVGQEKPAPTVDSVSIYVLWPQPVNVVTGHSSSSVVTRVSG